MKAWFVVLLAGLLGGQLWSAERNWFTVTGNPRDAAVNTVQVDPVAVASATDRKTMYVRVSRSTQRTNWEGVAYRSYESQVAFDCRARKAEYLIATYYAQPLWTGEPITTTDYSAKPQPMLFRDVEPNPTSRIVRAACRSTSTS